MAWKGKVAAKRLDQDAGTFALTINFFDSADPAAVLSRRDVVVPASATAAEIVLLVRGDGIRERAKFNDLKALDARIAVDDEVTV